MTRLLPQPSFAACLLTAAMLAGPAAAAEYTVADLGHALSPNGAIVAGNADGSIPAWAGGITTPPAGYTRGGPHIDPYAGEKPLYAITAANMGQYAAFLSPGVQAMLKQYATYRVDVYPAHRSFTAPQEILAAAIANAAGAHLAPDGLRVLGAHKTLPFPVPKNGLEAIWNHLLRYRGYQAEFTAYAANPLNNGDYTLLKNHTKLLSEYAIQGDSESGALSYYFIETLSPPLYAGNMAIAIDHTDPGAHPRISWIYNPGEQRVRRAPEVNFDTPNTQSDGLCTDDDLDLFNGSPERFNWKLIGRRELIVPYNDYDFGSPAHDYAEILKQHHVNPDLMRWEKHRVWEVEATVKPDAHHIYARRVFYFDEDSWEGLLADQYDRRGELWRVATGAPIMYYELPVLTNSANLFYDLQSGRYSARGLRNHDTMLDFFGQRMQPSDFTAEALRQAGVR